MLLWRGQGQQGWCADRKPGWQPACPVEEYSDETDDFAHAIVDPRLAVFTDTSVRSALLLTRSAAATVVLQPAVSTLLKP